MFRYFLIKYRKVKSMFLAAFIWLTQTKNQLQRNCNAIFHQMLLIEILSS